MWDDRVIIILVIFSDLSNMIGDDMIGMMPM